MFFQLKINHLLCVVLSSFLFSVYFFPVQVEAAVIPVNNHGDDPPFTDILYLDIHQALGKDNSDESRPLGTISIGLFGTIVPKTVKNFIDLAPIYQKTHTLFHRVIPGFVIQAGDFDGLGGHSSYGEKGATPPVGISNPEDFGSYYSGLEDENFKLSHNKIGRVSVANAGKNTGGSQFFICLEPQPSLDGNYVVFGQVIDGMDIAENMGSVEKDSHDKPLHNLFIYEARVETLDIEKLSATHDKSDSNNDLKDTSSSTTSSNDDVYEFDFEKEKMKESEKTNENSNETPKDKDSSKLTSELSTTTNDNDVSKPVTEVDENIDTKTLLGSDTKADSLKNDELYQSNHVNGFGSSSHHYVILPFLIFTSIAGYMAYKNRRNLTAMIRGPRYRRI
jgi:peptidyl-prolyl cis-trans isomerase B (cyclophilin B)